MGENTMTGDAVANKVKVFRLNAGLTQAALAERLTDNGVPASEYVVGTIESGRRRVDVDMLTALAYALNRPVVDFLTPTRRWNPETSKVDRVRLSGVPEQERDELQAWLRGDTSLDEDDLFEYWNRKRKEWKRELVRVETSRAGLWEDGDSVTTPEVYNPLARRVGELDANIRRAEERMRELGPTVADRLIGD